MVKPKNIIDSSGWTWIFRNNKKTMEKQIDYPFHKEVEKLATSFYVSNIPNSVDAKGLWKICASHGRLVDTYIANKLSKGVAPSQRTSANGSQFNHNITTKDKNPKPNPSSYPNNIPFKNKDKLPDLPSFASVTNGIAKPTMDTSSTNSNIRALVLDDQDLTNVEDRSMVLLVKLKDVNSMSNICVICRNEGFTELKIHHVGAVWIWIQFPSSSSTDNFQTNTSLKSVYSCIKTATPSFKVDERMIWIEICGLPLCAWGSNAYKKVVDMFGKFMFFEAKESTKMSSFRICISTKSHNFVSERVLVEVHGVNYDVHVHELGT
ncbi:hypothetical protein Tco_1011231 [Tanacetum coccineum]